MYNVTPHGTTGSAPTELMFNRVIRDKIPGVQDLMGEYSDSVERDRDLVNKQKGKEYADKRRGAKEINVEVGDKVFLKNVIFPHKLTPNFDTTEYVVKGREGDIIRITGGGKTLTRNVSHVKKIPQTQPPAETENNSSPSRSTGEVLQPFNFRTLDESKQMESTTETTSAPGEGLKLKLINKGGMWESVPPVISESERATDYDSQ
ncbi:hypothetical protein KR074_001889 [Drosophila pseudoananassae]|nr:hypothetical protein KR074_001889 [Drosophila pseudoananassae]